MSLLSSRFQPFCRAIRQNIYTLCTLLNYKPTGQQKELLNAVMKAVYGKDSPKIAVKSGQGTGKSRCTCVVALWLAFQQEDTMLVLTAPTMHQCRDVWLAEMDRLLQGAHPIMRELVKVTGSSVKIAGRRKWGVTLITANKETAAQGLHQKSMSILVEEASGVSRGLIEQFRGTASNPGCLFLMIGNPNTRDCAFFDCFNSQRNKWQTITFNAEDTPASEWFDPQRNQDILEEFGRDSDRYRISVLGEFPHADPNCVLSSEECEKATDTKLFYPCMAQVQEIKGIPAKQFGLDFARFGGDESTLFRRFGNTIVEWQRHAKLDPGSLVDIAFRMQHDATWANQDCLYVPDATGMGQGVMHRFHNVGKRVFEFHNGGSASNSQKYANRITEGWFELAKKIRTGNACIPRDNTLIQQLCGRQYYTDKKGRLVVESKDEYIKRGYDSPDRADGIVMAFYDKILVETQIARRAS